LAFTFANAIAYVEAAVSRGLDPNQFGQRLSFFFNAHNNFITEVSKFRAARQMWATIMKERFGVTHEKALVCRFHVQTGGSTLTASQIDNNVVRTTIQAMSAILGGTQSLHTNSKDEALALPTDDSVRLALRTQQIIAHESGIPQHPDPFGGSYVVEALTEELANDAFSLIEKIDELGGTISAIEQGWIQNEISNSAYSYQKDVDSGKQVIVGVNKFNTEESSDPDILTIDPNETQKQVDGLKAFKASRNNDLVQAKLSSLKAGATGTDNVMPHLIDCVKNGCTLGEVADVLRLVAGEYK